MNIDITSRNVTPSKELINFIKEKLQKLHKYDSNIRHSKVTLLKESRAEKVKIIITSKHTQYITESYSSTFKKTILNAIENIKNQIRKKSTYKTKVINKTDLKETNLYIFLLCELEQKNTFPCFSVVLFSTFFHSCLCLCPCPC